MYSTILQAHLAIASLISSGMSEMQVLLGLPGQAATKAEEAGGEMMIAFCIISVAVVAFALGFVIGADTCRPRTNKRIPYVMNGTIINDLPAGDPPPPPPPPVPPRVIHLEHRGCKIRAYPAMQGSPTK
jgi:hypothetical protein